MLLNFSTSNDDAESSDELMNLVKNKAPSKQPQPVTETSTTNKPSDTSKKTTVSQPAPKPSSVPIDKSVGAQTKKQVTEPQDESSDEDDSEEESSDNDDGEEEGKGSGMDDSESSSEEESESEGKNKESENEQSESDDDTAKGDESAATFESLGLGPQLVTHLTKPKVEGRGSGMGMDRPKLVQIMAVPDLMLGKDVVVKSQTGSGKTLAFLLPVVDNLSQRERKVQRSDGLYGIFLAPTRELCFQIVDVLDELLQPFHWIISTTLVGGEKKKSEKARLRKGTNLLVATPGRLLDHLRTTVVLEHQLARRKLRWLVLDEADRLMDSGFAKQMGEVLDLIQMYSQVGEPDQGKDMQTILISATISPGIKELSGRRLRDPLMITCDASKLETKQSREDAKARKKNGEDRLEEELVERNGKFSTPKHLSQYHLVVPATQRLVALAAFIRRHVRLSGHTAKLIVFVSCRAVVDFLHVVLSEIEWPPPPRVPTKKHKRNKAAEDEFENMTRERDMRTVGLGTRWWKLHGSVAQVNRRAAVKEFRKAKGGVLICTDVAARGLDLPSVDWVVQYEAPSEISEYVHRVGRTARNGRRGAAVIFLRPSEQAFVDILSQKGLKVDTLKLDSVITSLLSGGATVGSVKQSKQQRRQGALRDPEAAASLLQIKFEDLVHGGRGKGGGPAGSASATSAAKWHGVEDENEEETAEEVGKMLQLAQDAYLSALRAYAVHSKETKHIFQPKALHLGHEARGFALRQQPTGISSTAKRKAREERQDQRRVESKKRFRSGATRVSEPQRGGGRTQRNGNGGRGGYGGGHGGERKRPGKDRRASDAPKKKRAPLVVSEFGS